MSFVRTFFKDVFFSKVAYIMKSYMSLTGKVPESLLRSVIAIRHEYEYGGLG